MSDFGPVEGWTFDMCDRANIGTDTGLMDRIAVNIHPEQGTAPGIFDDVAVRTPDFYDQAYNEVDQFTRAMRKRKKGIGFLGILMMQRICSSVAAGRATASRMLKSRRVALDSEQLDDSDLLEAMDGIDTREFNSIMDNEGSIRELWGSFADRYSQVDIKAISQ